MGPSYLQSIGVSGRDQVQKIGFPLITNLQHNASHDMSLGGSVKVIPEVGPFASADAGWLIPLLVLFAAYIVRGMCGFGSGLIAIPLLSLFLPLTLAVPLVVILDFLASAGQGVANRHAIAWREVGRLLPFGLLGVLLGLSAFHLVDPLILRRAMGAFVLFYAVYSLWSPEVTRAGAWWAVPAGLGGGSIGTLFGTGGPFYVTYLKARGLGKEAFRPTFATIFLLDASARIAGYVGTRIADVGLLRWLAFGVPVMMVAMYLGGHIHTRISPLAFGRAISLLLVFSGLSLLR
ncbi:MAG: sulfite exporter TauE/SafE family protein [Gammaproteobacteria bacterium]|nr:MAG: sulfite exporter TauE/SafE family protein [Gammaproteobacteria bacterium]